MQNDEIKEILDKCKRQIKNDLDYRVSPYQLKQLLDYITNLQQENEELKKNKLTPDELANLLNQELIKQRDYYKSRIEKAVEIYDDTITYLTTINAEYMDSNTKKTIQDVVNKLEKELDILNGRSDE